MKKLILPLLALCSMAPAVAHSAPTKDDQLEYLSVYTGMYGLDTSDDGDLQIGLEYKFKPVLWDIMRPIVGANIDMQAASMAYGGVAFDFEVYDNVYLSPFTSVGLYDDESGKDLGGPVEFRSGVDAYYALPDQSRIGLGVNHVSNAGIYDHNPGINSVIVTYSVPTGKVFDAFK